MMLPRLLFVLITISVTMSCGSKDDADKFRFLQKGNLAYGNRNTEQALTFYEEALAIDSAYVDAWYNTGLVYTGMEHYDEAIFAYTKAIDHKPSYFQALLSRADAHYMVKQYYAALSDLNYLHNQWPDSIKVDFLSGLVYNELKQYDSAAYYFLSGLRKDSNNMEIIVNLGNIFYHQNQFDSSRYYLNQNFIDDKQQAVAFNTLSLIALKEQNIGEAEQMIDAALKLSPDDAYYLNNKGLISLLQGEVNMADSLINMSMRINPYNAWVYRNKGLVFYDKRDYSQAVRLLDKAFEMDDSIDNIHIDLAKALIGNGQSELACDVLAKAQSLFAVSVLQQQHCD